MMKPVINVADAETSTTANGEHFGHAMTELASALGARKTGVRPSSLGDDPFRFLLLDSAKNAIGYWDQENGERVAAIVSARR